MISGSYTYIYTSKGWVVESLLCVACTVRCIVLDARWTLYTRECYGVCTKCVFAFFPHLDCSSTGRLSSSVGPVLLECILGDYLGYLGDDDWAEVEATVELHRGGAEES